MPDAGDKAANRVLFEKYMNEAAAQGAQLIVFPESIVQTNPGLGGWNDTPTEEEKTAFENLSETIPGETTNWFTEKAAQIGIYVIFGMIERAADGTYYNSSVFLGPQGILGTYHKKTLMDNGMGGNEHLYVARGKENGMVVDSPLGKIGLLVAADTYAGYGIDLKKGGAKLAVTVADWDGSYRQYFDDSMKKTATGCNCWHVMSDLVGPFGKYFKAIGQSRILNPKGEILADTGESEGMIVLETGLTIDEAAVPAAAQP